MKKRFLPAKRLRVSGRMKTLEIPEPFRVWATVLIALGVVVVSGVFAASRPLHAQDLEFGPPYLFTGGFQNPFGIALDTAHDHLLVVDTGHHQVAWMSLADVLAAPTFTTFGYVADSSLPEALVDPQGVAVDSAGNVYVVDTRQNEVQRFQWDDVAGNYTYVPGFASDTAHEVDGAPIESPRDIAVGPDDQVYLLDSGSSRVLVADGPADTTWEVFLSGDWGNPYGITVDLAGRLYVADTDNHRILRHGSGVTHSFGSWGSGPAQFRYPRDVAVDVYGRMYVVDCFNHRVEIMDDDGNHVFSLGHAPTFSSVQSIAIDSQRRLYIVDSDRNAVIAYLGEDVPVPFDLYIRDYVGDGGGEPSDPAYALASPDILVRHNPDVDVAEAESSGLNAYAFQQPRFEQDNFVYLAVHNRGTQVASDGFVRIYWADEGSALNFPEDYSGLGFYLDETDADEGNTFMIPAVAAETGMRVLGPFLWHPPAPETASSGEGDFYLVARIVHAFDTPSNDNGLSGVRDNNGIALREVKVIRAPFPTGEQNTLVVNVLYPDIPEVIDAAGVTARIEEMADWIEEVSYGEVTVEPLYRGPVTLAHDSDYYASPSNNLLIEVAQDVLDSLLADEPELLDGMLPTPDDDIDRLILVTNDTAEVDWATTGHWPYSVGGEDRYLTVSVQAKDNRTALFSHGYSHQLGMVDLYPHEFVTLPFPYADGWDNMARPINGVHPLVWSKELPTWVTTHGSDILFIPRPPRGDSYSNTDIPLYVQAGAQPGENVGIAFGLTEGMTGFPEETNFFYVEARDNTQDNADGGAPGSGVLMYYVNEDTPNGHGPVMIRDHGSSPGHDLTQAAIPVGDSEAPEGRGITITVNAGVPDGPDYLIEAEYNPPRTDYDVYIQRGRPDHKSPDIWVQKQPYTYDESNIPPEGERLDEAVGEQENRIWALVHNHGPATAYWVDVQFHLSEPYHSVGDVADFDYYWYQLIPEIPADTSVPVFVTWTPRVSDPHSCVWVELQLQSPSDDNNSANNEAQQNVRTEWSTQSSPYKTVTFPFQIKNGEDVPQLVYFRADGIPKGWEKQFTPPKAYLMPGERVNALIEVTPPETASLCTSYDTAITAWTPRGDTLVKLGGTSLIINLGEAVDVDLWTEVHPCATEAYEEVIKQCCEEQRKEGEGPCDYSACPCMTIEAGGCTNPPLKNEEIEIRYRDEEGNPAYHFVTTDEHGCFHDYMAVTDGGAWEVMASVGGDDCIAPDSDGETVEVPIPTEVGTDPDCSRPGQLTSFSRPVEGQLQLREGWETQCDEPFYEFCDVQKMRHALKVELGGEDACDGSLWRGQKGTLESTDLESIFSVDQNGRGFHSGSAVIHMEDGTVIEGVMSGMINVNAHRDLGVTADQACQSFPYLDGQFVGQVVRGQGVGDRVIFDYFLEGSENSWVDTSVKGRIEGVHEGMCVSTPAMEMPAPDPAAREAACFVPVSKEGKGVMRLNRKETMACSDDKSKAVCMEHAVHASLGSHDACDKDIDAILDGELSVPRLAHVFEDGWMSRGYHGGEFLLEANSGVRVEGTLRGFTHLNTHKQDPKECLAGGHLQGILVGTVKNGLYAGCSFRALYVAYLEDPAEYESMEFQINIEGAVLCDCREEGRGISEIEECGAECRPVTEQGVRVLPPDELTEAQQAMLNSLRTARIEELYGKITDLSQQEQNYADRDRDGKVSEDEFLRFRIPQKAFEATDTNKDGFLSIEEITQYHGTRMETFYFERYDSQGKGTIPVQEVEKQWPQLAEADRDHDNRITDKN
jgi:M6 family metalloprotease-like protein